MQSAILKLLSDTPETDTLSENLGDGLPAATAESTHYLDDRVIHHGTVAGELVDEEPVPIVGDDGIHSEPQEVTRRASAEYHADLESGWAGATSGDGTRLLKSYLASEAGVLLEDADLHLEAFADALPEDANVSGIVYSQSIEDGHGRDRAGADWHEDASRDRIPAEGVSALAVDYHWDGQVVDAMLAASGYVAAYSDWSSSVFARWVADEVEPYLEPASDDQAELGGGA